MTLNAPGFVTLEVVGDDRKRSRVVLSPLDIAAVWEEPTEISIAGTTLFETLVHSGALGRIRLAGHAEQGEGQRRVTGLIGAALREREALRGRADARQA